MPTSPLAASKPTPPSRPRQLPDHSLIAELQKQGYQNIIGVDEVGRGALAGPVVVAVVQVAGKVNGVTDSKQLPKLIRLSLAHELKNTCGLIRFGVASNNEIDQFGISHALSLAYSRALWEVEADLVLTDHYDLPTNHRFIRATKGDSLFYPVSAASIIAKTYRDQLMNVYDRFYPEYGWAQNVGYGTAAHCQAIDQYGKSPLHRVSFQIKKR